MAFALSDFKKTSRKAGGKRTLYPHQLKDDRYLAAISYAIDYYERMVGRARHELQAETLLEFFGDPRLARGIVACLSRYYVWHQPTIDEVVDAQTCTAMRRLGLDHPIALRAHLYRYVNENHGGFLPSVGRATALEALCADLPLDRHTFETLLTLDAPANAVLVKIAGTPTPREIVQLYNYHSIETALCAASTLRLTLGGPIWSGLRTVHNLSRRYGLRYSVEYGSDGLLAGTVTILWPGQRDALGSYRRHGRRLAQALLRLVQAHPDAPLAGAATVHLQGQVYNYTLNAATFKTLGAQLQRSPSEEAWEPAVASHLLLDWNRAFLRGETGGWRLRRDPEPLITERGLIVPEFVALRGQQRASIVLADSRTAAEALIEPLRALNGRARVLVAVEAQWAGLLSALPVIVVPYAERPAARLLAGALPSPNDAAPAGESRWQHLQRLLEQEGFVDETRLAALLECTPAQLAARLQGWRSERASYLPGIGLCTPETVQELRELLQSGALRQAA
ncbi:DUF790 family protein [Kallotenue papyrolyticum]|uniref:DUF790 family protein n=1 Tax=Kallotenue papyrolyticum TaxID=1325125 RepID=UPI000492E1A1|nr:DUF790 family protein [Kallotenue papyrolyticum]